jgi:hypothetical protein
MLSKDGIIQALRLQDKDASRSEGYSAVAVHAWSHTTSDVKYIIDNIGEGVEILTPEAFIKRYIENVVATTAK